MTCEVLHEQSRSIPSPSIPRPPCTATTGRTHRTANDLPVAATPVRSGGHRNKTQPGRHTGSCGSSRVAHRFSGGGAESLSYRHARTSETIQRALTRPLLDHLLAGGPGFPGPGFGVFPLKMAGVRCFAYDEFESPGLKTGATWPDPTLCYQRKAARMRTQSRKRKSCDTRWRTRTGRVPRSINHE